MFTALVGVVFSIGACKKSTSGKLTPVCNGGTATYTSNVKTIIDSKCVSCHSNYGTYSGISTITSNGSFRSHVLTTQDMPKNGSLTQDQINTLECWYEAGYPQN